MKRFISLSEAPSLFFFIAVTLSFFSLNSCNTNNSNQSTAVQGTSQYLLVVNRSSHSLSIINTTEQKLVKEIPVGIGPHEISVSADNKYAFVANYGSFPKPHKEAITPQELEWMDEPQNSITKIDLKDLSSKTFNISKGISPHGVLSNSDGSKVWITDENAGVIREIDGSSGVILKEYQTMPGSHIIKSTKDFSKLFVSNIESNTVSVIDTKSQKITNISTPKGPEGMGLSPDNQTLWVLCNNANEIMTLNTQTLESVDIFNSQGKFPVKITFIGNEAWVVNVFTHNIAIFDAVSFDFKESIELESSPLGITSDDKHVYVTLPRLNTIQVYDAKTKGRVIDYPHGMEQDGMIVLKGELKLD